MAEARISINLRVPPVLHEALATVAEQRKYSMNGLVVMLLQDAIKRIVEEEPPQAGDRYRDA